MIKTNKALPKNTDFFFALYQVGDEFGEKMVEGIAWYESNKLYFKAVLENEIYQVESQNVTIIFSNTKTRAEPLTH